MSSRSSSLCSRLTLLINSNGVPLEGILCGRSPGDPREVLVLSPSANGESALLGVATEDITFVLPSFTSSAEATQCLNLPPGHPTIHQLLQKLRHLEIRVEEHTRRLVNRGAKDLYRQIQQPSKWRTYTDTTAALQRLGETRAIAETHLALHRILINDPLHFVADPIAMRTSGKFLLRSQQELELFVRVRGWVRDHSEELQSFAEKAAQARLFGAKDPPTLAGAKSNPTPLSRHEVPSSFDWTGTDRDILLFLRRTLTNERALQVHPYMAIAPSIIKAADEAMLALGGTNPYSGLDVGRLRMQAFLAEVGVVAPWEDWVVHDTDNFFHSWESVSRELLRNSREFSPPAASPKQVEQSEESSPAPLAEESSATSTFDPSFLWAPSESSHHPLATRPVKSGYYAADAFDSVRHDFNHLPVYTIDDAGAMELDDGISIVQAPSRTSTDPPSWWVHVHVADPTANLEPSHPLAMAARIRDHSEYFPERTWSMLPDWFIKEQGMSLGSQEGREQRTLSISMRVDNSGEVLESDVKVGIIRNVKRLTYSTVNKVLGAAERPTETTLTHPIIRSTFHQARLSVGRQHRETDDASLPSDSTSIDDLKTLRRLAAAMLQRRANDNALYWSFPSASVAVTPKLGHAFSVSTRPIFYKEAPLVTLTLPSLSNVSQSALSPAQLLVSEMMVAANRAAARFSVERGLPAPFRTQAAPVLSPSVLQEVLDARDPKTGEANGEDILRLGVDFLPGSTSVEPGPHWPMGVNDDFGYLRVTSPLRRYSDLFTHWQLKSALLPSSSGSSAPHFTRSAVLQHIEGFDLAHKARGRLSKHAEHYWALYVLKHKLDALSADPSSADVDPVASLLLRDQPLSALSLRDPSFSVVDGIWVQPVLVRELGVRATLYSDKQVDAPEKGEVLLVGVEDIKLGPRSKMAVRRRW